MGCATATIKYLVFIFNTLCALIGLGTVIVASLELSKTSGDHSTGVIFIIVIGSIVFLISFFGCCGAIKESVCLTWTYASIVLVLLICTIVVRFTSFKQFDIKKIARSEVEKKWDLQLQGKDGMVYLQKTLECCGLNGPDDYQSANLTIPMSCYSNGSNNKANLFKTGCTDALIKMYESAYHILNIFLWTIFGVEVATFVCASILAISFTNQERRGRY